MKKHALFLDVLEPHEKEKFEQMLADDNVTVKSIQFRAISHEESILCPTLVIYEEAEEQLAGEKEELTKLDKVAQELEKDENYAKLKNSTQRSLYLLSKYSIPSGQATKVIELVNITKVIELVNMNKIIIESGLSRIFEKGVESGEIKVK